MNFLAAVGAEIKPTIEAFKTANLLMLDGCAVDCGKKMHDKAGIREYKFLRMTDLGYVKEQIRATNELINTFYWY